MAMIQKNLSLFSGTPLNSAKFHAEVAGEEGHGQEKDGDERELFDGFVLGRGDGVEEEVDHVVGGVAHLIDVFDDEGRVVEDVGEVGVREGGDGDVGGGGGAVGGAGVGAGAGCCGRGGR